jgi:phosphoribosylaminoimidazolecarboxamide formyltransferase/IMP cyclohydrolase
MNKHNIKRALISVSNKTNIIELSEFLISENIEIISTGGTAQVLKDNNIKYTKIDEFTGFPEILDGRVKTLNPKVHAGILYKRDNEEHSRTINELELQSIDLVVVNLYPFEETISKENFTFDDAIENIDIGGPTLIRAAAKNFKDVIIIVNPEDYSLFINEIKEKGYITDTLKFNFAKKAFTYTAYYDAIIANYFTSLSDEIFPYLLTLPAKLVQPLRYGENPHQQAALYKKSFINCHQSESEVKQLHGKELSFNNIVDIDGAIGLAKEFTNEDFCAIIKHTNPCGAAIGKNTLDAFNKALEGDPQSAFGGIVCFNNVVDITLANELNKIFFEVIIAESFTMDALNLLKEKKNLRLIESPIKNRNNASLMEIKDTIGGFLIQDKDNLTINVDNIDIPTNKKPTDAELQALFFAWKIVKHVKSNAIVITNNDTLIGVGAGQMSRIDSTRIAIDKARLPLKGAVLASDAFFPFRDCVDEAAKYGIAAIIQPGGSIRDKEVIDAANEHKIAMVFTHIRHFKH